MLEKLNLNRKNLNFNKNQFLQIAKLYLLLVIKVERSTFVVIGIFGYSNKKILKNRIVFWIGMIPSGMDYTF